MDALLRIEAREELRRAAAWYEEQLPGLGSEFLDDFLVTIDYIEDDPHGSARIDPAFANTLPRGASFLDAMCGRAGRLPLWSDYEFYVRRLLDES